MTEITENKIYKLDLKIIMSILGLTILAAAGWFNLSNKVETNTKSINKVSVQQIKHIDDYRKMNNVVIKNNTRLKNIETIIKENKSDLKYLVRKSNTK